MLIFLRRYRKRGLNVSKVELTNLKREKEMKKQIEKVFGKKVFLLGKDEEGIRYWLEEPQWDCGWYWG